MRRRLRLEVQFEPVRLSADYLHHAYRIVVPIAQRTARMTTPEGEQQAELREHIHSRKKGKGA